MESLGNLYLLQYGAYTSEEVMNENLKKINNYLTVTENNKYYIYLGAFTNYENAYHTQQLLEDEQIYTYIKNTYVNDNQVIKKIKILDEKLSEEKDTNSTKELTIKMLEIYGNFINS